jgi:hypothetical protein
MPVVRCVEHIYPSPLFGFTACRSRQHTWYRDKNWAADLSLWVFAQVHQVRFGSGFGFFGVFAWFVYMGQGGRDVWDWTRPNFPLEKDGFEFFTTVFLKSEKKMKTLFPFTAGFQTS